MNRKSAELQLVALHLGRRRSAVLCVVAKRARYSFGFSLRTLGVSLIPSSITGGSTIGARGFNRFPAVHIPTAKTARDARSKYYK